MKISNYYLLALLLFTSWVQGQRMYPNQKGIELQIGSTATNPINSNYYAQLALIINKSRGSYQIWALEYTHQSQVYNRQKIPLQTYITEGGYGFILWSNSKKSILLNTAITALIGYEQINRGVHILADGAQIINQDRFIYGMGGRIRLETYLSDRFILLFQSQIKAIFETDWQHFRPATGLGFRFTL